MTRRKPAHDDVPSPVAHHGQIVVRLAGILEARGMTMTALAERVDMTLANVSILKNGHARAIRFTTLAALCEALDCQPGDLLEWEG
ncbi:MAG: helix-turn-helix transcriptional regulator [Bifidobacteriaceae bacterium]|jgi:putative transcriptional regulator|nr:helix-turn-helix transcriptional regulator [Bifidobacteriaceae bacterium]